MDLSAALQVLAERQKSVCQAATEAELDAIEARFVRALADNADLMRQIEDLETQVLGPLSE